MLFLNMFMLIGVAGLSIPIILHILNRRQSKLMEWGAMKFLLDSLASRRRNILVEEILLLAARCLIIALLALAVARPFVTANSKVPWLVVLPCGLLAVVFFGISFALWNYPVWRKRVQWAALALALITAACIGLERYLSLRLFGAGNARDVALVVDGSASMMMEVGGQTNFSRAIDEAKKVVETAPRGVRFSLIIAGGVPHPVVQTPMNDRGHLLRALDDAQPMQGTMRALDTLAFAAMSLSQGDQVNKQIILIGDGQAVGWNLGDDAQWAYLKDVFKKLKTKPQVVWRSLPLPSNIRNLTLSRIDFSRDVIGTDRRVRIDVTVENTGVEGATPQGVTLTVEDRTYTDHSLSQLEPGTAHTISFWHRFSRPGTHPISATVDAADELPADDTATRVAHVIGTLRVLIVEGSTGSLMQRPGGYLALSLMPDMQALAAGESRKEKFLVAPEIVSVADFVQMERFDGVAVVVLADVPTLPVKAAENVAGFVSGGGGLLVVNGPRSDAEFYNRWQTVDQGRVTPMSLEVMIYPEGSNAVSVASDSATIDTVRAIAENSDLSATVLNRYWKSMEDAGTPRVAMRLSNGDAFIAERVFGQGCVLQILTGLDTSSGNLTVRHSFLPLMHELVYYLARPYSVNLNVPPAMGLTLMLAGGQGNDGAAVSEGGLRARYFADKRFRRAVLSRIDPTIDFSWGDGAPGDKVPADNFSVRWTGQLHVPVSGEYSFYPSADDRLRVTIGKQKFDANFTNPSEHKMHLDVGVKYTFQADFEEDAGSAGARLEWSGPGIPRGVIPSRFFTPGQTNIEDIGPRTDAVAVAPDGEKIMVFFVMSKSGIALRIDGSVIPGLYAVEIPASLQGSLAHFADTTGRLLFYVLPDAHESILTTLTDDELTFFSRYVELMPAKSLDDLQRAVKGNAFGRELWRILAMAMFLLLIAEIALTRWIAMQRKTGEEGRVAFDDSMQPSASFREQVEKLTGTGGQS